MLPSDRVNNSNSVDKHTDEDDHHHHALIDQFNQDELMEAQHHANMGGVLHQAMDEDPDSIHH